MRSRTITGIRGRAKLLFVSCAGLAAGLVSGCGEGSEVVDGQAVQSARRPEVGTAHDVIASGHFVTSQGESVPWEARSESEAPSPGYGCLAFKVQLPAQYAVGREDSENRGCVTTESFEDVKPAGAGEVLAVGMRYLIGRTGPRVDAVRVEFHDSTSVEALTQLNGFAVVFEAKRQPVRLASLIDGVNVGWCELVRFYEMDECSWAEHRTPRPTTS